MTEEINPTCCEFCGSMVSKQRALDGARYYIPVADPAMFASIGKKDDIDFFIYDRLIRAEKIITDLRKQLEQKCTNAPSSK